MMEVSTASTASPGRLLHEQLRGEIALLQLELNQLTTVNSQLLRRQERQAAAPPTPPPKPAVVDAAVDATGGGAASWIAAGDAAAAAAGVSPLAIDDFRRFELDDDWTTTVATPSPMPVGSRTRMGSVYGASASRLCPVVVAGDDEPSFRVCEVGTDARGNSVIVHSARKAAAAAISVVGVHASVGPDAGDDAANDWRSMCAVSADECANVAHLLIAAAETMAAGERVLLGDGAVTSCDLVEAPRPMSALLHDDDGGDNEEEHAPARARANAAAAFANLKATVEHVHDRATELRDTALARQVALSTYLQRCEIERRDAEIDVQNRLAAAEARAGESASELADARQLLAEAQATTTDLESQLVRTYRDFQQADAARDAAEQDATVAREELRQTSTALRHVQSENAALKQALERMEAHATSLEAAAAAAAQPARRHNNIDADDDTPDREFRPSAGPAGGTSASPQSAGADDGDVTPSTSSVRRRHVPITSPAAEEEVEEASHDGSVGLNNNEGGEPMATADPVAVSTIQHLTQELLRRQHHLARPAAA
jgi:hypothetical protein